MNKNIIQKKMMNSIHLKETIDGVAEKSINSNLRDYQILGNTVQDNLNLFDLNEIKMTDTTTNELSISIVDGAVHIEGTPTKTTTFLSVQDNTSPILFKKGVYKIIAQEHLGLNFYTVENNTLKQVQKASTVGTYIFTLEEDYYLKQWFIWFNAASVGVEYNYTTIPTITKNLNLTEEVPYISTVSPDNPVEVVSVGELVTEGENVGKYEIPIEISNGKETVTEYIYLTEPLRKIGEHHDYIDFRNQKVYRNVRELVLTGKERIQKITSGNFIPIYRFQIDSLQLAPISSTWSDQKCNYYYGVDGALSKTETGVSVYYSNSLGGTHFRLRDTNFESADEVIAWLQEKYAEGNPLVVCYQSYDTIEEDIELPRLPQYKGQTIYQIATNIPSEFVGTYKTRL